MERPLKQGGWHEGTGGHSDWCFVQSVGEVGHMFAVFCAYMQAAPCGAWRGALDCAPRRPMWSLALGANRPIQGASVATKGRLFIEELKTT